MFYLYVQDDNDLMMTFWSRLAYATKPTLVITRVRTLHITKQHKDTLQRRLMIYYGICVPIIIPIQKDLTKLFQK